MIFDEHSSTIYRAFPVGRCGILRTLGAHKGVPAIRYEMADRNPITAVRQSGKRERVPVILEVEEWHRLFGELALRERTMIVCDALTGMRRRWPGRDPGVTQQLPCGMHAHTLV
jgi:integrase